MAGLFDDLIPQPQDQQAPPLTIRPGAPSAASAAQGGLFDDLIPKQSAGADAAWFDPEGTGPANYDTAPDNRTAGQRAKFLVDATIDGLPFSDRAAAAVQAIGGQGSYADNLAAVRAREAARMQQDPAAETLGQVGAGLVLPLGAAGEAIKGATLGAKVLRGAASGAGVGGLYGASSAPDLTKPAGTAVNAGLGAAGGAIVGGAGPALGGAAGAVYRRFAGQAVPAVEGVGTPAQQYLMNAIKADGPGAVSTGIQNLGQQGMMADYGPALLGVANGLATKPGVQNQVIAPLIARNEGVNARLGQVLDQHFGPVQSPFQVGADISQQIGPLAAAQQQALRTAGPVDTTALVQRIESAIPNVAQGSPEYAALMNARRMLTEKAQPIGPLQPDAPPPAPITQPVTNPRQVYSARQALDDQINYGGPTLTPPSSAMRSQQGAFQGVRAAASDILKDQVPGYREPTEAIAALAKQRDANVLGVEDLSQKHYPADFQQSFQGMTPEEQDARRLGQRFTLEKAVGTKANDLQALKNLTQGEEGWNAQVLGHTFGPAAEEQLNARIAAEQLMRNTHGEVVGQSGTARKRASAKALADAEFEPHELPHVHNLTMEGIIAEPIRAVANKIYGSFQKPVDNAARDAELASAITAQGDRRNRLIAELLRADRVREGNAQLGARAPDRAALAAALLAAPLLVHDERRRIGR